MDLRIQPKPEVNFLPADRGVVSRKEFFVKKKFEQIQKYFFPALFIRQWKPKVELLFPTVSDVTSIQYECDFNREIQNCFVEDYAEEIFLRTPPPCFVVFGKSGNSVVELSKQIAREYGSVFIHVDDIVERVLQTDSDTARLLDRILRLGVALSLNFILALMSYVAHSAEARHRGYVLCGIPNLPLGKDMPAEEQFNYLFTWDNKPTVFVNVLFEDEDLVNERTNLRCEVRNLGKEYSILRHYNCEEVTEENDEIPEAYVDLIPVKEDVAYEPDLEISPSRPWVQLPRDEESRVWTELELFDTEVRPAVELILSRVDPQYYITVDSRVSNEFEIVKARLNLLQIWKVPEAVPFLSLNQEKSIAESEMEETEMDAEGSSKYDPDEEDILRVAEEPPQVAFRTLFAKKTISPKFRWELSHYNYVCPVSLREGLVVEGKSKFAVSFMKYIYFLRDWDCVTKFLKNPRAYVLPIRPKPLCRFFVLGYPLSGKTTLAQTLAKEFSIPLLNVDEILKIDAERKKNSYLEFCRQKAECRELIRLTALAWQDWRIEEEARVNLIEEWIMHIQNLLRKRIEQFYSPDEGANKASNKSETYTETQSESDDTSGVVALEKKLKDWEKSHMSHLSPSAELIEAVKQGRTDYNKDEANSYLSTVWRSFSGRRSKYNENTGAQEYYDEGLFEEPDEDSEESDGVVNWCDLLPPQSLSSFLISKLPYTTRVKRKSFKVFLEAASKAYHDPSKLKSEFVKWHLPCYMDIPLCEIFLKNPIILLKYIPSWLKERPLIPDPVDPMHPSVVSEGDKAIRRANVVVVRQNAEEQGILLRNAIEKAEREGMRVTGEVLTPGGWVVDNMTLDLAVWKKLICENVFADHIYILTDSEPNHKRIINTWWEAHGRMACSNFYLRGSETEGEVTSQTEETVVSSEADLNFDSLDSFSRGSILSLLAEWVLANAQGDRELDDIYQKLECDIEDISYYLPPFPVDPFCHSLFQNTVDNWNELRDDSANEESMYIIQMLTGLVSRTFFWNREVTASFTKIPLGKQLEKCTSALLEFFKTKPIQEESLEEIKESLTSCLDFFKKLIKIPEKLDKLKELFEQAGRSEAVQTIDINGKTPLDVFTVLREKLVSPFTKRPRELEDFEIEEIKACSREEEVTEESEMLSDTDRLTQLEDVEDIRIFGESGELCIVSLERNRYIVGKLEHSVRYWGKLYYFWNREAKNKFLENPEKYAPYYSAIRCYPSMRIYIVGPMGSGRSTVATTLSRQFNLSPIDYAKFLSRSLVPFSNPIGEKYDVINRHSLLLAERHNPPAKALRDQFMRVPFGKRQFWLEHSFHTTYDDNKEIYDLLNKIAASPITSGSFPELKYMSIESAYDYYGDNYLEEPPRITNVPEYSYTSMKELADVIENYLQSTKDLTDYCLEKSVKLLWQQEPYVRYGFILEAFPMRAHDMAHIVENNWIPDLVIELILPERTIIERNVGLLMDMWEAKLKKETAEQEALELALTTIQSNCRLIRQKELYFEKMKRSIPDIRRRYSESYGDLHSERSKARSAGRKRRMTQDYWGLEDDLVNLKVPDSIKAEVEDILDAEYPPLIFNPVFETYSSGKERITQNLTLNCRRDLAEIEKVKSFLGEMSIPWIEIDGLRDQREIKKELFLRLDKMKSRDSPRKEFAFSMKMEMAEKLLEQGYYFLSKFGRLCPVQVYRKKNPIHMFRPLNAKGKVTPIAYRNYIYFVGGENEKQKFIGDPLKYIFNDFHCPTIPLRVAVIGPPKSGKSTLSKRLGAMFNMKVVTMGSALRFALEEAPQSTLAKSINGYLRRGCFLPLSLKVEALMFCLNDPRCVTQGFVFDGIPFDAALTQSLSERGKLPYVIISLTAESHLGKVNRDGVNLKEFRLPYKNRTNLDSRYKDWQDTYKRFANWNQGSFNNVYELDAKLSAVDIFYQSFDIIKEAYFNIQNYFQRCINDEVLPLKNLCISLQEYQTKRSAFLNNCPVCWEQKQRLKCCVEPRPKTGLFQYLDHIYWICPEHPEIFKKNPRRYLPPQAPKWPDLLPEPLGKTLEDRISLQLRVHGYGRCPVTRTDFPSSLEWEGSWDFAASYRGEIFLCKNEKMLERFLAQPWRYFRADTKFEVNRAQKSNAVINLGPPKITSLPPIGFLEQTISDLLHHALQIAGSFRPVYPDLHPRVTACIFLALFLKVNNKNKSPCSLDVECYNSFLRSCKATNFKVNVFRPPDFGLGHGDYEPDPSEESETSSFDSSHRSNEYYERNWLDFETQASKRMWSAKNLSEKYTEMKLTEKNELEEISEIPATVAILKYQNYNLRGYPLPPVEDCLNYIYSIPPRVQLREKFNYNSLHQQPLPFTTPFTPQILFNPQKQFSQALFHHKEPSFPSSDNLHDDKRVLSDSSVPDTRIKPQTEPNVELLMKGFFPRFQLLDKFTPTNVPETPQVVEKEPIALNPHRDYAYMMLLTEFFHNTHFLRCFALNERNRQLEYLDRLDNKLEVTTAQIDYLFEPRITPSVKSRTSVASYQEIFDSFTPFLITGTTRKPSVIMAVSETDQKEGEREFTDYLERVLEKVDEPYTRVSFDSFEVNVVPTNSDESQRSEILIHEILPYPPLQWDIISRPYYSYYAIPSIFQKPHLEDIAHERHVSLLDGITELHEDYKFVPYPTNVQVRFNVESRAQSKRRRGPTISLPCHFYYDFFNIPWTSFLTCPYNWVATPEGMDFKETSEAEPRTLF